MASEWVSPGRRGHYDTHRSFLDIAAKEKKKRRDLAKDMSNLFLPSPRAEGGRKVKKAEREPCLRLSKKPKKGGLQIHK